MINFPSLPEPVGIGYVVRHSSSASLMECAWTSVIGVDVFTRAQLEAYGDARVEQYSDEHACVHSIWPDYDD